MKKKTFIITLGLVFILFKIVIFFVGSTIDYNKKLISSDYESIPGVEEIKLGYVDTVTYENFARYNITLYKIEDKVDAVVLTMKPSIGQVIEYNNITGRVLSYQIIDSKYHTTIDPITNYEFNTTISINDVEVINKLVDKETQAYIYLKSERINLNFISYEINPVDYTYNLKFTSEKMSYYFYEGITLQVNIYLSLNINSYYITKGLVKDFASDYEVILTRCYYNEDNELVTEEVVFKIIDLHDNKLIVEKNEYIGSYFMIHNIYN